MNVNDFPNLGGYVTDINSFSGKNRRPSIRGLFSQQIFGPFKTNKCECGNYTGILYKEKICPKCNVICSSNEIRSTQFGKIKLIFPYIKPTKKSKFLKLIKGNKYNVIIDNKKTDYNLTQSLYLAVSTDLQNIKVVKKLGINDGYISIPFCIKGIYSLYICLKFLSEKLKVPKAIEIFDKHYISHELKVLPPNLRLITYDIDKKTMQTPDINKHYTNIIKINKKFQTMADNLYTDEQDWINMISTNMKARLLDQDIIDPTVMSIDINTSKFQYHINNIYEYVFDQLSGRFASL